MRKFVLIMVFFVFISALLFGRDKFFVSAGAAAVFPADNRFKDFYGSVRFSPDLKAGFNFLESFYLWLGYSRFSASYTDPVLNEEANINQHFLAIGIGWETRRGRRLQSDFFAGLILAGFKEQAMGEAVKDSVVGFELGTGLRYFIKKKVFVGGAFSYSEASASLAETEISLGGKRLLGGMRLIANLGIRL
jgi:opacity protein-like surface antigen